MEKQFCLIFLVIHCSFGQSAKTERSIEKYAASIDQLKVENKLLKVSYPEMSGCSGALDGYYLKGKLVLMEAVFQAELGYSSRIFYVKNNQFLKATYREHFAEWEKYKQKYPEDETFDAAKMAYSDTVYTITFARPIVFRKMAYGKEVSRESIESIVNELVECGESMRLELETIRK